MKLYQLLLIAFCFSLTSKVAAQYDLTFKLDNFDGDTLIIGNYYADKQLVKDTLYSNGKKGVFEYKGSDTIPAGVYFLMPIPRQEYIQFFIRENDANFKLTWNTKDVTDVKVKGSEDNQVFLEYVDYLAEMRPKADVFRQRIAKADSTDAKDEEAEKFLKELDQKVEKMQDEMLALDPDFMTVKFVKANRQIDMPSFDDVPEDQRQYKTYRYYKDHYFDNIDIGDPANLRTPYLHQRIEYYIQKLTPQDPDSISASVDYILGSMEERAPESFRYYLSYFLNEYAKMKIVGMDAVYVHLVDNYYAKGKADWVDEETLTKIVNQAEELRPSLIGKTFPNVKTYKMDGSPIELNDIESPYTVVVFWAYDCGHCTKAMPDIVSFYDEWESKGVTLMTICTKGGEDKTEKCKEAIPKKNMDKFLNTFDPYQRYRKLIQIKSTPKIFILDSEKKILIKDIPAKELKNIMPDIIKMEEKKSEQK